MKDENEKSEAGRGSQPDAPEAPHVNPDFAECWQSGWRAGFAAALSHPSVLDHSTLDRIDVGLAGGPNHQPHITVEDALLLRARIGAQRTLENKNGNVQSRLDRSGRTTNSSAPLLPGHRQQAAGDEDRQNISVPKLRSDHDGESEQPRMEQGVHLQVAAQRTPPPQTEEPK